MSLTDLALCIIALEIPVAVALLAHLLTKDVLGAPEPYFPHATHRIKIPLNCSHHDEPFVIYPGGITACQACYEKQANQTAS